MKQVEDLIFWNESRLGAEQHPKISEIRRRGSHRDNRTASSSSQRLEGSDWPTEKPLVSRRSEGGRFVII